MMPGRVFRLNCRHVKKENTPANWKEDDARKGISTRRRMRLICSGSRIGKRMMPGRVFRPHNPKPSSDLKINWKEDDARKGISTFSRGLICIC